MQKNELLQIAQEYYGTPKPYVRDIDFIAKYINKKIKNKKIIFYGDGFHTKEVINHIALQQNNIAGIIKSIDRPIGYNACNFKQQIISKDDIKNIDFDKIIFLGNWNNKDINNICLHLNISNLHAWNVYQDDEVVENSITKSKQYLTTINLSSNKPKMLFVTAGDYRDYITVNSQEISKKFSITKIYYKKHGVTEKNEHFDNVLILDNDFYTLVNILNEPKFDLIVFQNMSQDNNLFTYYLMCGIKQKTKVIVCSCEYCLNDFSYFSDAELAHIFTNDNLELLQYNKIAEKLLLKECDGFISNYFGKYFDENILHNNKNSYSCMSFLPHSSFCSNSNEKHDKGKIIKIVYAGSMPTPNNPSEANDILNSLMNLSKNSIVELNIFSSWNNKKDLDFYASNSKLIIHDFVNHLNLPQKLVNMNYGLVWLNTNKELDMKWGKMFSSIVNAKFLTYIAAGIPIIIPSQLKYMCKIVENAGIGIVVDIGVSSNIDTILNSTDYMTIKQNMQIFQKDFMAKNHPKMLTEYLELIYKGDKNA